jgi:hypothetical protein
MKFAYLSKNTFLLFIRYVSGVMALFLLMACFDLQRMIILPENFMTFFYA